jgi:hypothetical protein
MGDDNNTMRWLFFGMLGGVVTPTILFIWNRCCGVICSSVHSLLFQTVAARFGVSEHRFEGVSNIPAITRVLRQLGMRTHRFRWHHDANADTDDSYQVGTLRLPTQSWVLWLLAMLDITHYIWVKDDGSAIVVTGPTEAVHALLRVSNLAANRLATEKEVQELRFALGLDPSENPTEQRCVLLERLLATSVLLALAVLLRRWQARNASIMCCMLGLACLARVAFAYRMQLNNTLLSSEGIWRRACLFWRYPMCCGRFHSEEAGARLLDLQQDATDDATELVESRVDVPLPAQVPQPAAVSEEHVQTIDHQRASAMSHQCCRRYSIVVARSSWFEVLMQKEMDEEVPLELQDIAPCATGPKLFAMSQRPSLSNEVARRVATGGDLLYVCVHNPMVEVNLVEMAELLRKADKGIILVIVLPVLEHLEQALPSKPPSVARLHANKESRYVATLADLSTWFMVLSTGIFPKVIVIMPFHSRESLSDSLIWQLVEKTVDAEVLD